MDLITRLIAKLLVAAWMLCIAQANAQPSSEPDLPSVPKGFTASVFATDPLVRNPCAMAFDARGRIFVGQGPQYRKPKPDTQPDRVTLLIDSDNNGVADKAHTFAEGFNSIQGMAWNGDQLWVANAPDLTVVRDTNGDDVADEYRRIYGGLGNLEHALHGLSFAPDGRLYMTKGNSKGYNDAESPEGFVAPEPFADLWGIEPAAGAPTSPLTKVFTRDSYKHGYHTPSDDWGTQGGVLRCRADGTELEVFARGMRNTWDMSFDANFDFIGTDQDQDGGDRILNPFLGAHFGWGHPWSPHWTGENHLPSTPISGPVYHGSGTGVTSCTSNRLPERYRNAFFCSDWLNRKIFVYRPKWDGASMRNMATPEVFAKAPNGRSMGSSEGMVFDPTDIEFGPDGALWVLSWGHGYGAEMEDGAQQDVGRVYRISFGETVALETPDQYQLPSGNWSTAELIEELRHHVLPIRRTNAQTELVRRGISVASSLQAKLDEPNLPDGAATWLIWTLAQLPDTTNALSKLAQSSNLEYRRHALRALGFQNALGDQDVAAIVRESLNDEQPRVRFAAVQSIQESKSADFATDLWKRVSTEKDRNVFYASRITLKKTELADTHRQKLASGTTGERRAALMNLLEMTELTGDEVLPLRLDADSIIAELASSFVEKVGTSGDPVLRIEPASGTIAKGDHVRIITGKIPAGLHVRYSLDGTEPTDTTGEKYKLPIQIDEDTVISASLFLDRVRMGPVLQRALKVSEPTALANDSQSQPLPILARATTIDEALAKLPEANAQHGADLFFGQASCSKCHRMGDRGNAFAPNLTDIGNRAAPKVLAESILMPSAVITEGFHSTTILTEAGKQYSGFIKQESGLNVELVQADGTVIAIPRASIEERVRQPKSVMPEGLAKQLSPQHVADLIRFIAESAKN